MENFKTCYGCGRVIADDERHDTIGGETFCDDCAGDWCECYECGAAVRRVDAMFHGGDAYCEDCFDACFSWCERCESYERADEFVRVRVWSGEVEYWCDYCARNYTTVCDDCGERICDSYMRDEGIVDRDGRDICPRCRDAYYYCGECDDYVHEDEYDTDAEMCVACAGSSGRIKKYHDAPRLVFYGNAPKGARWRGIGCELEIDRNHPDRDDESALVDALENIAGGRLYYERDGSLDNGFEIITHPHTMREFAALDWERILDACSNYGYTSHDNGRCGLHFHISRAAFGATREKQERAIAKLCAFYDAFYADIVKISRRDPHAAERWAARYPLDGDRKKARDFASGKKFCGRYTAVNITNAATIEIRIMRGTLNPATFRACADFAWRTALNAKRVRWRDVLSPAAWLDGVADSTAEYIKARGAFAGVL